jgi:translation initiation factor 1A
MAGRILKGLGDRNMLVYCNDGKERIAHIRGGLRKKVAKIEVGDIVLISLRGDGMGATQGSIVDKADILAKYERESHGQLKKYDGINPKLFAQVENMDAKQRSSNAVIIADDCGFDMDASDEEEEEENGEMKEETKQEREKKKVAEDIKRITARNAKNKLDDDINIDDI